MGRAADEVGVAKERVTVLARRLLSTSGNIGAVIAIIFGVLAMALEPGVAAQGWLQLKLALVLVMLAVHLRLYQRIRAIEDEPLSATRREFAILHGVVSLLLLGILAMVLLRPF